MNRFLLIVVACALVSSACSAETPGPFPVGTLEFVVSHPDAEDNIYTLSCTGDIATLVGEPSEGFTADSMCLALGDSAVRTRLIDGADPGRGCLDVFGGPDAAAVRGELDGNSVDTTFDRVDSCGIDEWDFLMAQLLPPPRPES